MALGSVLLVKDDTVFGMGYPVADSYYLTQRADILAALKDPETFTRRDPAYGTMPSQLRRTAGISMSPRVVKAALQPELHRRATVLLDAARRTAWTSEAFIDLTDTFACEVFLALLGIPMGGSPVELPQVVSERRTGFSATLLDGTDPITVNEAVELFVGLIGNGRVIDTVAGSIRNALTELDHNPKRAAEMRADPTNLAPFADDIFQHFTPLPVMVRETTRAVTLAGVAIPPGSRTVMCIEAASVGRTEPQRHLAFGTAADGCIGHHLSKLALTEFVRAWLTQ